jgi:hypothetical protein
MCDIDRPHLPGLLTHCSTDRPPRDVMQTLYETSLAVSFDGGWFEAYVTAPAPAADRFTLRYNNEHDYEAGWERTEIHPAALKRELRERDWQLVADLQVPKVEAAHDE